MPKLPKWIGDFMESSFVNKFCNVRVIYTEYLNVNIKRIRFEGDFSNIKFREGQAIIFRINDNEFRNYTPSLFDAEAGICEVLFHLHGNGPGSNFIDALKFGDQLSMGMPRGFSILRQTSKYHFFFGDETTIGLFKSLKDAIDVEEQNYIGVLEMDKDLEAIPEKLGLMLDVVPKSLSPAETAIKFLNELDESLWNLWKTGSFYLMGNAHSIQNFRKALRIRGIANAQIVTQPFWVEGKSGL